MGIISQLHGIVTWVSIGFALILVVEGLIYALFPRAMKRLLTNVIEFEPNKQQLGGTVVIVAGLVILQVFGLKVLPF